MLPAVRVLYMEDDEGTARLMQKRLSRAGYQVDVAPNGREGLHLFASGHYDVVLVDYNMPELSGLQVVQRLAEQDAQSVIIMLTGTGNERIAVEALKLGAADYVVKDVEGVYLDLLPTIIEQGLKNQQLMQDKRLAEEALRESEERFRMLFEYAPDPYYISHLDGTLIDCNRAVEMLLGLNKEDLLGKNVVEIRLLAPEQIQNMTALTAHGVEGHFSDPEELTITRPDGRQLVVDIRAIPMRINGQALVLGIGRDITWRKQAEAQMKAHIEQLKTLHQIDDDLTRRLDMSYVQQMALDILLRMSGARAGCIAPIDEGQIQEPHSVGYPEIASQPYSLDTPSIVARVVQRREAEWVQDVAADPDYFPVWPGVCSQIVIPLISQERLIGIVSLETDQPDRFNAERFDFLKLIAARIAVAIDNAQLYATSQQQLVELQDLYVEISKLEQLKTDMIRIAAHDLRNPLSVVFSYIGLLRKTVWDQLTEKQQKYIVSIDNAARQMKSITADFLSLDRIEETALGELQGQKIDLVDLVQGVFVDFCAQSEQKNQTFKFSSPETPILVQGYRAELRQAVTNLVGNAIKYTPAGGTIDVILQQQNAMARFEVVDSGYGIPEAQQDKLFQPFFRVQSEETASIEGTGLGLYLVSKIVERHGGQVIFRSQPGNGSIFGFELPLYG